MPEGEEAPQEPPPPPPAVEEDEDAEPEPEVWNAYTTVKGLTISISGLKEGKRYKFRVAAKNIMGMSSFTESRQPVEIKEQMCESSLLITLHRFGFRVSHYDSNHNFLVAISGANYRHARDSQCQSWRQAQGGGPGVRETCPQL